MSSPAFPPDANLTCLDKESAGGNCLKHGRAALACRFVPGFSRAVHLAAHGCGRAIRRCIVNRNSEAV